jgi:acetoin utilization deacetylase AcuC-like enzyme
MSSLSATIFPRKKNGGTTTTHTTITATTTTNHRQHRHHQQVYLAYDDRMMLHKPIREEKEDDDDDDAYPIIMERPERIGAIYQKLMSMPQSLYRFLPLPCIPASREAIQLVHSPEHYDRLWETAFIMSDEELDELTIRTRTSSDVYYGRDTFFAARMAVGGVMECVKAVTNPRSESYRAIAVVRPPGHHALHDEAMGRYY